MSPSIGKPKQKKKNALFSNILLKCIDSDILSYIVTLKTNITNEVCFERTLNGANSFS